MVKGYWQPEVFEAYVIGNQVFSSGLQALGLFFQANQILQNIYSAGTSLSDLVTKIKPVSESVTLLIDSINQLKDNIATLKKQFPQ